SLPALSKAVLIFGAPNVILWLIQSLVTCRSSVLARTSSTQSVSSQPVAVPGPPALTQNGLLPAATILSARAVSSSHVLGTVYPAVANALTGYQIIDFTSALVGMLQMWSPSVVRPMVDGNSAFSFALSMKVPTSMSLPSLA